MGVADLILVPLALVGFVAALFDRPWGGPLLLVGDLLGGMLGHLSAVVVVAVAVLLVGAVGLRPFLGAGGGPRWTPALGLVAGGLVGFLATGGGYGLLYGMIGGTMAGGLLMGASRRRGPRSAVWVLEALRWPALVMAGIWLLAHLV
jgi:hypothetical protein